MAGSGTSYDSPRMGKVELACALSLWVIVPGFFYGLIWVLGKVL